MTTINLPAAFLATNGTEHFTAIVVVEDGEERLIAGVQHSEGDEVLKARITKASCETGLPYVRYEERQPVEIVPVPSLP